MLYIRKVPGSNLSLETGYTVSGFFVVFLGPFRQIPGKDLKLGYNHFLPYFSQSIIYTIIYHYVVKSQYN
jgi:hypothetical protein